MWVEFWLAFAVVLVILYLPGAVVLRALGVARATAIAAAPPLAVAAYELICIAYGKMGIPANVATVIAPVLAAAALFAGVLWLFRRKGVLPARGTAAPTSHVLTADSAVRSDVRTRLRRLAKSDGGCLLLYIAVSFLVALWMFVGNLGGPDSFPQDADNSAHLAWIRALAQSQILSTLDVSSYSDLRGQELTVVGVGGGYYPAAWHMLCAFIVQLFGASAALAENVVNLALLAAVLPTGMYLFLRALFGRKSWPLYCGALVCLAFPTFPWGVILPPSGPVYPNFASMCFLPFACWGFLAALDAWGTWRKVVRCGLYFVVAMVAAAFVHPSVVFTAYVIMGPLLVWFVARQTARSLRAAACSAACSRLWATAAAVVVLVLLVAGWCWLFQHPAFQGVIHFPWGSFYSTEKALRHVAVLSFGRFGVMVLLPVVLLVGVGASVKYRMCLPLVFSFLFFCAGFVLAASTDGFWDRFLTGFWYTDSVRIAANAGFAAIPLAALGLGVLLRAVWKGLRAVLPGERSYSVAAAATVACGCLFIGVNFAPQVGPLHTAFDDVAYCLRQANDLERSNTLSPEERQFAKEVKQLVGTEPLILNVADDGSCFLYATDGLNLVNRQTNAGYGSDQTDGGRLRKHIDELATSEEVQRIVRENHIEYVLVLDEGGEPLDERCYHGFYKPDEWAGFNRLTENTPGFQLVLSSGDMKLYKIDESYL